MKERIKLGVVPGWPGQHVEYTLTGTKGSMKYLCSVEDWAIYELKVKLVALGASEEDLDELESLAYGRGYDSAQLENEGDGL